MDIASMCNPPNKQCVTYPKKTLAALSSGKEKQCSIVLHSYVPFASLLVHVMCDWLAFCSVAAMCDGCVGGGAGINGVHSAQPHCQKDVAERCHQPESEHAGISATANAQAQESWGDKKKRHKNAFETMLQVRPLWHMHVFHLQIVALSLVPAVA
jgi:hypothetical protein